MSRLLQTRGPQLDGIVEQYLGLRKRLVPPLPERDARLCALAFQQLQLAWLQPLKVPRPARPDLNRCVTRRCGLPSTPKVSVRELAQALESAYFDPSADELFSDPFFEGLFPDEFCKHPRSKLLLIIPDVARWWLGPVENFCRSHQPVSGSSEQRAQVCDLLCRCGWADEPRALWLVIKELQWDSVELLHFVLQQLRQHHNDLWPRLAHVLEDTYGSDAVLPLHKALDPELTVALVVAAPAPVAPASDLISV